MLEHRQRPLFPNMNQYEPGAFLTSGTDARVSEYIEEHSFFLGRMMPSGTDYTVRGYSRGAAQCHMTCPWGLSQFPTTATT